MTTFFTAMNKNTSHDNLTRELAVMPRALESVTLDSDQDAIVLARLVSGLNSAQWDAVAHEYNLENWHAVPVASNMPDTECLDSVNAGSDQCLYITPFRDVGGILTKSAFLNLLQRELKRLSRLGGSMSLVCVAQANKRELTTSLGEKSARHLDALLGATLLAQVEVCDAVGLIKEGTFICSLPGFGQLAARHFAETAMEAFNEAARPYFPTGGINAGKTCGCAMGIVNILQGDASTPAELMNRARASLDKATRKEGTQIHQESSAAPLETPTLVQSSEKQFLFFGGDPK